MLFESSSEMLLGIQERLDDMNIQEQIVNKIKIKNNPDKSNDKSGSQEGTDENARNPQSD